MHFVIGFKKSGQAMVVFANSSNGLTVIKELISKYYNVHLPAFDLLEKEYSN